MGAHSTADIVICGAGIAGISAAYHLAVRGGGRGIVLLDPLPPLSLTSDKSSECYRNWWPDGAMVALMNRSIDLLEALARQTGNSFHLNRRGYLYLTGNPGRLPALRAGAEAIAALGAGTLRTHTGLPGEPPYQPPEPDGFAGQPDGADLFLDSGLLHRHFPYIAEMAVAGLHARRAGWFSGQQLGAYLLEQARAAGVQRVEGRLAGVERQGGRVQAVRLEDGRRIATPCLVLACGPLLPQAGRLLGLELPVYNELHLKMAMNDPLGVIPRDAPLLIWEDPQRLPWDEEERQVLAEDPQSEWLTGLFPGGAHTRPEGGGEAKTALMLWEYKERVMEPAWPIPNDPAFPEVVLRGLATMLPGLRKYFNNFGRPWLDGGYYTRTRENRPLIGPLPLDGAFAIGALSGYGLMASQAAGELVAAHLTGEELPPYAPAFCLERYDDLAYLAAMAAQGDSGQL